MNGRDLAKALHDGKRVYGTAGVSTSPLWPGMMARAGLDFVFIDTEHVPIPRDTLAWMCRAYAGHGVAPIVRIPKPDPYRACMVLDGGAAGVVAPYVETQDQVRDLRGAVKLRPLKGRRLHDTLEGRAPLEDETAAYLSERNEGRLMIVNVESVPALEALDDILEVPDIDALLVGPHDLSINLGVPEQYGHPRFNDAISTIIRKARAKNVGVGIHYSEGIDKEIAWAEEGANLIIHSSDISLTQTTLARDLDHFRQALDGTAKRDGSGTGEVI